MSTLQNGFLNEIHLMTPFLESDSLSSNIGMPQPAPQREDLKKGEEHVPNKYKDTKP
jgi:hypothetical protein